jgi:hypothetical protein
MIRMKPIVTLLLAAALVVPAGAVRAQLIQGPVPSTLPLPPPIPPPRVYVPEVPKLDATAPTPRAQLPNQRRSFGDRVTDCLTDPNAARLGPNARAAYSRACANQ